MEGPRKGGLNSQPHPLFPDTKSNLLRIGAWNVRTLNWTGPWNLDYDFEPRKTVFLEKELLRLDMDIVALSETRWLGSGKVKEREYTIFWCGKEDTQHHGVGFAIKNRLLQYIETPVGLSPRLMKLNMYTQKGYLTLISVYAPTMKAGEEEKDSFYRLLEEEVKKVPARNSLLVLGDFNARVGRDWEPWSNCLGKEGVGKMNSNGQRVLELCQIQQLCVTNTYFAGRLSHKTTWQHPRSRHWHQLDLVLCRRKLLKEILHTRAYRSADVDTDHSLVACRLRISLMKIHSTARPGRKRLDRDGMKDPQKVEGFLTEIGPVSKSQWDDLGTSMYELALKHFGSQTKKGNDWFDDSKLLPLIEAKRTALQRFRQVATRANHTQLRDAHSILQRETRRCANSYWLDLCGKIQYAADHGNLRVMYAGIKTAIGPTKSKSAPLQDMEGNILTDKDQQLQRWTEHYGTLYGEEPVINLEVINQLPDFPCLVELDAIPTVNELQNAIIELSNNKATGSDGIPAEMLKLLVSSDSLMLQRLHGFVISYWNCGEVPQSLKDAQFVQLYKNKGEKSDCNNYRGISLLSVFGKAVAKIVLQRLQVLGERIYPESQCGFRPNRSTVDMIFTLRQLQEKCREKRVPFYAAFVDLTKAFDTVSRTGLYTVLKKIGCPPTLLKVVQSFHNGMQARVIFNGDVSQCFPVKCGVKQGCVMAPCLFNIYFSCLLYCAFQENTLGVYLHTRFDGGLFNVRRFHARTKVFNTTITDLLFADDAAFVAHTSQDLQTLLDRFTAACTAFGLVISEKKTVVLHQPVANQSITEEPEITLNGKKLDVVERFCYLGSYVSRNADMEAELNNRIGRATSCLGQLRKRVWENRKLRLKTKITVYKACVLSVLLYGSETWPIYAKEVNRLNTFHLRNLRRILGVSWRDKVTNVEVLEQTGCDSMHTILSTRRLRWLGHVCRLENNRLPKITLYSETVCGSRSRGRPLLRFNDRIRDDLRHCGISATTVEQTCVGRMEWRRLLRNGASQSERRWREEGKSRRKQAPSAWSA